MDKQKEQVCKAIGNSLYFACQSYCPLRESRIYIIIADSMKEAREIAKKQFGLSTFTVYKADATNNCQVWEV